MPLAQEELEVPVSQKIGKQKLGGRELKTRLLSWIVVVGPEKKDLGKREEVLPCILNINASKTSEGISSKHSNFKMC